MRLRFWSFLAPANTGPAGRCEASRDATGEISAFIIIATEIARALVTGVSSPLRHLACSRSASDAPARARRMRAAGRSLVRSIRRARESARAGRAPRSRSAFVWSRRRWSSSSFSRDGTRWAPSPFASLPSFAAGARVSRSRRDVRARRRRLRGRVRPVRAPDRVRRGRPRELGRAPRRVADVADGPPRARRRALRLLSKITLYIDHHDAVLAVPEVRSALLEALRLGDAVDDQSRALVLGCLADLAKHPEIRARRRFLRARRSSARRRRDAATLAILAADPRQTRRLRRDATHRGTRGGRRHARNSRRVRRRRRARASRSRDGSPAWATMSVAKRVVAHRQLVRVEDDEDVDDDETRGTRRRVERRRRVRWCARRSSGARAAPRVDSGARKSGGSRARPTFNDGALDRRRRETRVRGVRFGLAASNAPNPRPAPRSSRRGRRATVVWHARSRRVRDRVAPAGSRWRRGGPPSSRRRQEKHKSTPRRQRLDAQDGDAQGGDEGPRLRGRTGRDVLRPLSWMDEARFSAAWSRAIRTYGRQDRRVGAPSETSFRLLADPGLPARMGNRRRGA